MSEREIQQVMAEWGFDYIQARNHVKCRKMLQGSSRIARVPVTPFRTEPAQADVNAKPPGDENTIT